MNPENPLDTENTTMDATTRVEAAREKLAHEMRTLVGDAEEMLRAAQKQGGENGEG